MAKCIVRLHPKGLDPFQASKAWLLQKKLKQSWRDVRKQVRAVSGNLPGQRALRNAVHGASALRHGIPKPKCANCGRTPMLSPEQKESVVAFVKKWRSRRFCTSRYITGS